MPFFNFVRDSFAPTLFGWTPGLRGLSGGRALPCGCLTGTYQTWRVAVVVILDARGSACPHAHHRANLVLWRRPDDVGRLPLEDAPSYADPA